MYVLLFSIDESVLMAYAIDSKVAILMATYQGERYIYEQLESFNNQSYKNWQLAVSDDGSKDNTLLLIQDFASKIENKVQIFQGPGKGFVGNFLSLLFRNELKAQFYSFSDQDDIWHRDKLARAVDWLSTIPTNIPALYCSRTHLINNHKISLGFSPLFKRLPSFSNSLVQNIGGGNTMVFNQAARDIILKAGLVNVVSHDWWIYILLSGVGGKIHYDQVPGLDYRQHGENLIGTNLGLGARLLRLKKIFQGQYRKWNALHIDALKKNKEMLTVENQRKLFWFEKIHNNNIFLRLYYFSKLKLYRQSIIDTLAIFIAVLFKKV